jgi:hypothetical protein
MSDQFLLLNSDEPASTLAETGPGLKAIVIVIQRAMSDLQKHSKGAVAAARAIGQNLAMAKERVPYGDWEVWVQQNTSLSLRTAQQYMKLSAALDQMPYEEAQRVALLSVREAIKAITGTLSIEVAQLTAPSDDNREQLSPKTLKLVQRCIRQLDRLAADMELHGAMTKTEVCKLRSLLKRTMQRLAAAKQTVNIIEGTGGDVTVVA